MVVRAFRSVPCSWIASLEFHSGEQMRISSFEPVVREIVQVLVVFFGESVEGDRCVGDSLGVLANMVVLVMYTLATRFLPITIKGLFDAWPAITEVEGIFEGCDMVFVEFSRGIVGVFQ
jgi:hypothetical protein